MKKLKIALMVAGLIFSSVGGFAQKGVGNRGVARNITPLEILEVKGSVREVEVGPCELSIGQSISGTHLIVLSEEDETFNLHLGPTYAVSYFANSDLVGKKIEAKVFRTEDLSSGHLIVKELLVDGQLHILRDSELQPMWSDKKTKKRGI